tara:strand:- start:212 stop:472 length:261 start_codon:yes stop_codon:yes gene_type:complete
VVSFEIVKLAEKQTLLFNFDGEILGMNVNGHQLTESQLKQDYQDGKITLRRDWLNFLNGKVNTTNAIDIQFTTDANETKNQFPYFD